MGVMTQAILTERLASLKQLERHNCQDMFWVCMKLWRNLSCPGRWKMRHQVIQKKTGLIG